MSEHAPATIQDPLATDGEDPRIECEITRGRQTWRFVCPRSEAGSMITAAFELADSRELDRFDVSWLALLIERALAGGSGARTTTLSPTAREDASGRIHRHSRTPWSKDSK